MLFWIIGDNTNNNSSNYLGTSEALAAESDKLKLIISHKDEMLKKQNEESSTLKEMIALLKKNNYYLQHQQSATSTDYHITTG